MTKSFIHRVPAPVELVRAFSGHAFLACTFSFIVFSSPVPAQENGTEGASRQVAADIKAESDAQNPVSQDILSPDSIVTAEEAISQKAAAHNVSAEPESVGSAQVKPESVTGWLEKMTAATRTLNFQVAYVVSRLNQETVPYLWRHGVLEDGTSVEQLNLQNGPGRELIRVGDVVSIFEPDTQPYSLHSQYINGPIPGELLYEPVSLTKGYEFVSVGRARVAGRPAQQIRIVSRDNTRFSYQLWLDEQSGMLLKLNTLDLQGNVLEQIQVTSLTMSDTPPAYFARVNRASLPRPLALTPSTNRQQGWEVDYLPDGMVEVKRDIRRLAMTGQVVEYKLFSDGLVDVSVYVQPASDAIGSDLVLRHDLSTFLTLTDGKAQVTVIGEIPLQTANAIATSLKLKEVSGD